MFDTLADWAEEFIGVFQAGAEVFVGLVVGIIPLLIVLLTAVNAFVALVGPERVDKVGDWAARPGWIYTPIRLPDLAIPVGLLPDQPDGLHQRTVSSRRSSSRRSTTRPSRWCTRRSASSPT